MKKIFNLSLFKKKYYTIILKGFILLLIFLVSVPIFAQRKYEISGKIKGEKTGENLMYCSVKVLNNSDSLITGGVTNEKGYFSIPVKNGYYKLAFRYVGFIPDTVSIGYINSTKFIGVYKMKKDLHRLEEVNIKASSRKNNIDKDIQIVTDKMRKGAVDAREVMEKVSGLSYDRYNNTISVDNSSKVIILVEGVEKNQEYIKNLSPKRLKKIEVIRNPGGKYGLEGYSAIINIILRKDYVGQELFISNQFLLNKFKIKDNQSLLINNLNITYNYSLKKVNLYGAVSNSLQNFDLKTGSEIIYNSNRKIVETSPNNKTNMLFHRFSNNYTFGIDYYINPQNTISFESNISMLPVSNQKIDQTMQTDIFDNGNLVDSYKYETSLKNNTSDAYNSIYYVGKLSKKSKIEASFNYNYYKENYENKTTYENLSWRTEQGFNKKNFTKLSVEFYHKFNSKLNAQVGYGNIWKRLDNIFNVTGSNASLNNSFVFKQTEVRHNIFGYLSHSLNKKISYKVGLAAEYSNPVTENQNHKYFIYQPFVNIGYVVNKIINVKLMYRTDSHYPTIMQTNPFSSQLNPTSISTGNPNLKPSVINKLSFRLNFKQGLISVKPYYSFSKNYISQTGSLRTDGLFEYSYNNIGNFQEYGIQTNFTIPFGKLFIWQNSMIIYNSSITYENNVNKIKDWKANSQLIYRGLKNNGVIVLNYRRNMGKNINAIGYSRDNTDYWLLLIQQPFFKNRFTVMAGYFLPVSWGVNYDQGGYVKTNGFERITHTDVGIVKNMLIFRLTYRFSKGKIKKADHKRNAVKENKSKGIF